MESLSMGTVVLAAVGTFSTILLSTVGWFLKREVTGVGTKMEAAVSTINAHSLQIALSQEREAARDKRIDTIEKKSDANERAIHKVRNRVWAVALKAGIQVPPEDEAA